MTSCLKVSLTKPKHEAQHGIKGTAKHDPRQDTVAIKKLGKGVIICGDTPGFLGNRIGVYAMQIAMTEAIKMNLSIEEADAVFGRPMGIPKQP